MTEVSKIESRVEKKREQIAERMQEIEEMHESLKLEYAELEAQCKLLDELMGDDDDVPFEEDEPDSTPEPEQPSTSPPKTPPKKGPDGQKLPMKPPSGQSAPRPYGHSDEHPPVSAREALDQHLKPLLKNHPGMWFTSGGISSRIERDSGVKLPSRARMSQLLIKISEDGEHQWLHRHTASRKSWYSLHSRHGGSAPNPPTPASILR